MTFGAYHVSPGHIRATIENVIVAFEPEAVNLTYRNGQKKTNHFQRGQSVQFLSRSGTRMCGIWPTSQEVDFSALKGKIQTSSLSM